MGTSGGLVSEHGCSDAISSSKPKGSLGAGLAILLTLLFSTYMLAESAPDIYKAHCSACHGINGKGDTMLGKNLKLRTLGSDEVQNRSDEELTNIITRGRNRMPSFDRKLSKDQIAALVRYIRSLKK